MSVEHDRRTDRSGTCGRERGGRSLQKEPTRDTPGASRWTLLIVCGNRFMLGLSHGHLQTFDAKQTLKTDNEPVRFLPRRYGPPMNIHPDEHEQRIDVLVTALVAR
jgi:hypothetical protein